MAGTCERPPSGAINNGKPDLITANFDSNNNLYYTMEKFYKNKDENILSEVQLKTVEKKETTDDGNFIEKQETIQSRINTNIDDNPENKLFKNDYASRFNQKVASIKKKSTKPNKSDLYKVNLDHSVDSSVADPLDESGFSLLSELDEEGQKELFEKLRTKKGFYVKEKKVEDKLLNNIEQESEKKALKTFNKYNNDDLEKDGNEKERKIFQTNIDAVKQKNKETIVNEKSISKSRSKSKSKSDIQDEEEYIPEKPRKLTSLEINFPAVQLIKKNTRKMKLINQKKRKMNSYDFFNYDKAKWPSMLNGAQKLNAKIRVYEDRRKKLLHEQILSNFDSESYEKEKLAKLDKKRKFFEKQEQLQHQGASSNTINLI